MHSLLYTNKEAQQLLSDGLVEIGGLQIFDNSILDAGSEVKVKGKIVRSKKICIYLKFYKPPGYQSSLHQKVADNLFRFFDSDNHRNQNLAIAGRLDKMSEGLLLLSNDGKWIEKLCNPKFEKEKEYLVTLDKGPDATFIQAFENGVNIGNYITRPCACKIISQYMINVILKEGKNRQIRRMCKVLGYRVTGLKRIRIGSIQLNSLQPGDFEIINDV